MLSVGVDIIEVSRLDRAIKYHGQRFLQRVFTEAEQADSSGRLTSLAGRFAIKEAVAKALGTGIGDVLWHEIEVQRDARGKPELVLHGNALARAQHLGLNQWAISLSHTQEHAIGFAVGQTELQLEE